MKMKGGFNKKMAGGCMNTMAWVVVVLVVVLLAVLYYFFVYKQDNKPVMPTVTAGMKEHFESGDADLKPKMLLI